MAWMAVAPPPSSHRCLALRLPHSLFIIQNSYIPPQQTTF